MLLPFSDASRCRGCLEVLIKLVGVCFGEATLDVSSLRANGVEDATAFGDSGLPLFQWQIIRREEFMENLNRVVLSRHRLAAAIPGEGEAGAVSSKLEPLI